MDRGPARDLLALVGADRTGRRSPSSRCSRTARTGPPPSTPPHARDPLTLLALRLGGEPLHPDHGYPCRLIAPNRPGVLQTKWVGALTVVSA